MDSLWINLLAFLSVFTLAIISPGPNFILVVNRSLTDSRSAGIWTSLGVALGSWIYGLCGLLGWIVLLNSMAHFGTFVRWIGGAYLVYLGSLMLLKFWRRRAVPSVVIEPVTVPRSHSAKLLVTGLATNLSNPKAWAFYLSLFTVVLAPGLPLWSKGFLSVAIFIISFCWYALVAVLISSKRIQPLFLSFQSTVQGLLGSLLIFLGASLLIP